MVLTMAAVAAHKGITLTRLAASVESCTEFAGRGATTRLVSRLDLGAELSPRERRILYNSARQCEVHKMLRGEIKFEEQLVGADEQKHARQGGI
jgi:uncharacterized OsmC-like protein